MKFFNLVIMITGVLVLLNFAGFNTPVSGGILSVTGLIDAENQVTPENFKDSDLYSGNSQGIPGLKYIFTMFAVAGLVLGAFGRAPDIRYITAGFVWLIVGYLTSDVISLLGFVSGFEDWMKYLLTLIIVGLLSALYISALSYWQGSDG